jgi:uncharacterized flavoprotein (TIGR03862 family)
MKTVAIIGGGPAGLRAAEVAAGAGASVTVFDAKSSVGRKFLVAGKGGLNLTKEEPLEDFLRAYSGPSLPREAWNRIVKEFPPEALREWATGLGVETFAASTGRVYPREMKAAPLLRRWVQRLRTAGVHFAMRHRWRGLRPGPPFALEFETQDGPVTHRADAVVLALGGGSWPDTGSDGRWLDDLRKLGISVSDLQPANCGWEATWPAAVLEAAEGRPLKNITARAGEETASGELLIAHYGLEGGAIYQLGAALRALPHPRLTIDLKPSVEAAALVRKLGLLRRNFLTEARTRWKLSEAAFALLSHFASEDAWRSAEGLALAAKELVIPLTKPRPLAEAISSAGGVRWENLDNDLMTSSLPGLFCAGEMIDWEAPTGGYLMQGCFASGSRAGAAAAAWAERTKN